MADPTANTNPPQEDDSKSRNRENKEDVDSDPELFSCLLQTSPPDSDPNYIGIRRLLLYSKAEAGVLRRRDWRCNGKSYVAYRITLVDREMRRVYRHQASPALQDTVDDGCHLRVHSPHSLRLIAGILAGDVRDVSQALGRRTSFSSNASDIEYPHKKGEHAYSFVGMHCIFDQCKAMVTVIKFGNMSSDLLAYGASDGSLTVCTVSVPPSIQTQLTGHTKDVTVYIASASMDKTVNNNFLSVGNSNKEITVFNFSTGRTINKSFFDDEVTAMDHDRTGQLIFCGDAKGCVYTVKMNSHNGSLSRSHRHRSKAKQKSPVTVVQYRMFSLLARGPVLLTFCRDESLSFFSVSLEVQGYLTLLCT
ncbi:hypothetical protein OROGR_009869 [Orobanche gracilis]